MANAQADAKKKFGGLFGKKDGAADDEEDAADGGADEAEEGDEEEPDTGYDLKACANDIMAAVKAGDVDALSEALEELIKKRE